MTNMDGVVEVFAPGDPATTRALVALKRPPGVLDVPGMALVGTVELLDMLADWSTIEVASSFVTLYTSYMRGERSAKSHMLKARVNPGEYVYVIDGRVADPRGQVPFHDIVGWYRSDSSGAPIPESFTYNTKHRLVSGGMPSSILSDPQFIAIAYGP